MYDRIFLGHRISQQGIEVDRAKVDIIARLSPPNSFKGVWSFLEHVGFYVRFIKDFSKISKPLTTLLQKDQEFELAFETLKEHLISAPILQAPNWTMPFELMTDTSKEAMGVV